LEIYANAFEHGQSPNGIFSCGQHFPRRRELNLTVVDFGVGIPSNVRRYLKNPTLSADSCMEWASHPGNTTKPKQGIPGGVGLDLLRDFVKITDGKLEIFSHEGYILMSKDNESYSSRESYFEGTLVNIKLHCDSKSYFKLSTEPDKTPLF
jgi:two-component sensor histidine kinase